MQLKALDRSIITGPAIKLFCLSLTLSLSLSLSTLITNESEPVECCNFFYRLISKERNTKLEINWFFISFLCSVQDTYGSIFSKEFELINWFPAYKRMYQCMNTITLKLVKNPCPYYLNVVYEYVPQCRI